MVMMNNPDIEVKDIVSFSITAEIRVDRIGTKAAKTDPVVDPSKITDLL
ncbi:hypothetical protein GCM10025882_11360 [Acinetobacter gyllenbergii]|nr:hypothetical protein GCM10025882_11360 [Acinetobacter gyllenbergii]